MAGYDGKSMSNNAVAAYADGEMPKSKWTKGAIINAIAEYLDESDRTTDVKLSKMKKADLFDEFIEWSSWHHTNMFFAETDFYQLNERAVDEIAREKTDEELAQEEAEIKARLAEAQALRAELAAKDAKKAAFKKEHGFAHNSAAALRMLHPECCHEYVSKKGNHIVYINYKNSEHHVAVRDLDRHSIINFSALED